MGMELNSTGLQASFSALCKVLLGKCNDPEQLIPLLMIAGGNGVQSGPVGGGSGTLSQACQMAGLPSITRVQF